MVFREPTVPGAHPYRFKGLPVLTCDYARDIVEAARRGLGEVVTSLDAGLSITKVRIEGSVAVVGRATLELSVLEEVAEDDRSVYAVLDDGLTKIEAWSDAFYKLVRTSRWHAPTLEINGIHMHRVKGTFPELDALAKVRLAGGALAGARVLDTCMGLGYTAIWALRRGAASILTVERSPSVIQIAEQNPWSRALESEQVRVVLGDVAEVIGGLPDSFFQVVIHDPPRFALAGELYSMEFYAELARVMTPNGVLVHYVGSPRGRARGVRLYRGVVERLESVGFVARFVREHETVVARRKRA